jgi:hypothetical protein
MKFNRNNVGFEDNFQAIKYTEGVRPGKKLQMLKRSAEEMYDASAAVLTKGLLNFKPAR